MGTSCSYRERGQKLLDFFVDHGVLSWSDDQPKRYRVLDTALVNLKEYYVALEIIDKTTGDRHVRAVEIMLKMFPEGKDGFNIC